MTFDGKILSQVRQAIAEDKAANEERLERRRAEVYSSHPQLKEIETRLTRLMTNVVVGALQTGSDAAGAVRSARSESEKILSVRAALLRDYGYPEDYLDERFSCEICRDSGYVKGKPCQCLIRRYNAEAARELSSMLNLREQCFESFDEKLYPAQDGSRAAMQSIFEVCRAYAENFGASSANLLFRGSTGLGKTFLSASIARVVSQSGHSVVYDTAVSVFDAFEAQKFGKSTDSAGELSSRVRRYLGCDLLILDDLGTEMTTSFTVSALYSLINSRLVAGKPTIISTNLSAGEVAGRYSPQIVSRLEGDYTELLFVGSDIRIQKRIAKEGQ